MPDLNVKKTNEHLWTLIWGAVVGVIACVLAFYSKYTPGAWQSPNDLVSEPGRAIVTGFFIGAGAHELKLWVGRRLTGRR